MATGRRNDLRGYAGLFVRRRDVDAGIRPKRPALPTVSEFTRQVGIANAAHFGALVEAGLTPVTVLYNPQTRRRDHYVGEDDAAAFRSRFTTLKLLSATLEEPSRSIVRRLDAAGVTRFQIDGADLGPIYLAAEIGAFLGDRDHRRP